MDETNEPSSEQLPPAEPAGSPADDYLSIAAPPPPPPPAGFREEDPYWSPQAPRRGSTSIVVTALLVAVAVLAGIGIGRSLPTTSPSSRAAGGDSIGRSGTSTAPPSTGPSDVTGIAAKIDPSLVDIDTTLTYEGEEAAGTGIILSSTGLVLTNNHVIDQANSIVVTAVATGRRYTGEVVGYDETSDVALVQAVGASGLDPATLDTSKVAVGQGVVAVGNAGGKGGTPTSAGGTITALDRSITATDEGDDSTEKLSGLIRTDAYVQPGDSGGSLVNTKAQVVGMDTAASDTFSFSAADAEGFAIPISSALGVARAIEAGKGSSTLHVGATAFIGVTVAPTACVQGGKPAITQGTGALVCSVVAGTAAASSGLAKDDVITSLAGQSVATPTALTHLLVRYHPGEKVQLGLTTAAGQKRTTSITFGSGPPG